jgi:hypothetical protein
MVSKSLCGVVSVWMLPCSLSFSFIRFFSLQILIVVSLGLPRMVEGTSSGTGVEVGLFRVCLDPLGVGKECENNVCHNRAVWAGFHVLSYRNLCFFLLLIMKSSSSSSL